MPVETLSDSIPMAERVGYRMQIDFSAGCDESALEFRDRLAELLADFTLPETVKLKGTVDLVIVVDIAVTPVEEETAALAG